MLVLARAALRVPSRRVVARGEHLRCSEPQGHGPLKARLSPTPPRPYKN